jgi:hypothetical protein
MKGRHYKKGYVVLSYKQGGILFSHLTDKEVKDKRGKHFNL